jgi:PAS domain S-box-containing protein
MLNFYKISIKNKIIIIILTISISSLLIVFSTLFISVIKESKRKLIKNTELHAKLIAEYLVSPLDFNDKNGALDILSKSEEIQEIVFLRLYDSNNTIFVEYGNKPYQIEPHINSQKKNVVIEKDFIHIYQSINYKNEFIGTVYLLVTNKYIKSDRLSYFIRFSILFIFILILVIFFSVKLQKYISKPILELANKINNSAISGDYSVKIEGKYEDEIGQLYKGYNNFLDQIASRELEKEEVQKKVREREQHLRTIFNATDNVAFIVTDLSGVDTKILDFSPGAEKIFGYRKKEVLGEKIAMLHLKEDVLGFPNMQDKLKKGEKENNLEATLVRKSGEQFPALFSIYPWHNSDGDIIGTFGVSIDITKIKEIENELKKHHEYLEEIVNERTKELVDKNEELEVKNKELEKYQELFIGREFRIKELKDKIKELEENLNR